jgi:peptidoglycan-associated lipoprotein
MSRTTVLAAAVLGLSLAATATACKKKAGTPETTVTRGPEPRRAGGDAGKVEARTSTDAIGATARDDDGNTTFAAVHFEFDSSQLDDAARAELQRLAEWMSTRGGATVTLEGHTDDRGTDEYNLALGERRARAMRDYLTRLGVPPARIKTISYGEERPAATGADEGAWAENRRGEIVPQ